MREDTPKNQQTLIEVVVQLEELIESTEDLLNGNPRAERKLETATVSTNMLDASRSRLDIVARRLEEVNCQLRIIG